MCGLINFITISTLLKEIFSSENLSGKWDSISDLPDFRGYIYVSGKPKNVHQNSTFLKLRRRGTGMYLWVP
jgi:hypothetical protein